MSKRELTPSPFTASAGSFQQMSSCGNGGTFVCSENSSDCSDNTKVVSPGIPVPYAIPSSGGASKITPYGVAITSSVSLSTTTAVPTDFSTTLSNLYTGDSMTTAATSTSVTLSATPVSTSNSDSGGLGESDKIGIGVGVSLGVVALAGVAAAAFFWGRRRASKNPSTAGPNQFCGYGYREMRPQSGDPMGISPKPGSAGIQEYGHAQLVEADHHDERRLEVPPDEGRGELQG